MASKQHKTWLFLVLGLLWLSGIGQTTYEPPISQTDTVICRQVREQLSESVFFEKLICITLPKPKPSVLIEYRDTGSVRAIMLQQQVAILSQAIWQKDSVISALRKLREDTPKPTPSANPRSLKAVSNHFRSYITWDSLPAANYFDLYANDTLLTRLTGFDTWVMHAGRNGQYKLISSAGDTSNLAVIAPAPSGKTITLQGDYTRYDSLVVRNRKVIYPKIPAVDVGKAIAIAGARSAQWYRLKPLWYHGTITQVLSDGTAMLDGEPIEVTGAEGYTATNYWQHLQEALADSSVGEVKATGVVYADPVRLGASAIPLAHPAILLRGDFVFGQEDHIGKGLRIVTGDQPVLQIINHISGSLGIIGSVRGPLTVGLSNQSSRSFSTFYKRNLASSAVAEFHFAGRFGNQGNYRSGFTNLAENKGGMALSGKDVVAYHSGLIFCAEPFSVYGYTTQRGVVTPTWGKRLLVRNTTVTGSAFVKPTLPVMAVVTRLDDSTALVVVDSLRHPEFTFHARFFTDRFRQAFLIFKDPATPPGPMNVFANANLRQASAILGRYRALVPVVPKDIHNSDPGRFLKPLVAGSVEMIVDTEMQPGSVQEGHFAYNSSSVEIEWSNIIFRGLRSFALRQSDYPEFKGPGHRQVSVYNVTWQTDPDESFDFINRFGGYVQYKRWPGAAAQLQSQGIRGKGLVQKSTVSLHVAGIELIR